MTGGDESFADALVTAMGDLGYGLVVANPEGEVLSVNQAWSTITGVSAEEAKSRPFGSALAPEERAAAQERHRRRLEGGEVLAPYESVIIHADGRRIPVETGVRIVDVGGQRLVLAFIRDISERKRHEELVEIYRALVDEMPIGVAVWALGDDPDDPRALRLVGCNRTGAGIVDAAPEDLIGRRLDEVIPELLGTDLPGRYLEVIRSGRAFDAGEVVYRQPASDRVVVFAAKLFPLPGRLVGTAYEDVTSRYRADRDRRLLLRRLASAEDTTLRRIAADVHDQPVQYVTALNHRLGRLKAELAGSPAAAEAEALEGLAGVAISQLRRILFELQPPGLPAGGLADAVRVYVRDILGATEPPLVVDVDDVSQVDPGVTVAAFRVLQEALSNAYRHAGASRVRVAAHIDQGHLCLDVSDDGVGFDEEPGRPGHLGLQSMRERTWALGGTIEIARLAGGGTAVRARLPLSDPGEG